MRSDLSSVPDLFDLLPAQRYGDDVLRVVEAGAARIRETPQNVRSISGRDLAARGDVGLLDDPLFRRLVVAAWVADWAAYGTKDDRVDLVRLLYVMDAFPEGFRVWFWRDADQNLPVGYTGWYPVASHTVDLLTHHPDEVEHRGQVVPLRTAPRDGTLYVFNYGIVAPLRGTQASRTLMHTLRDELRAAEPSRLVAITVSEAGTRCAARFGMRPVQTVRVGESTESVCVGAPTL